MILTNALDKFIRLLGLLECEHSHCEVKTITMDIFFVLETIFILTGSKPGETLYFVNNVFIYFTGSSPKEYVFNLYRVLSILPEAVQKSYIFAFI